MILRPDTLVAERRELAAPAIHLRRMWIGVFAVTLALSGLFSWAERFEMGSDGVAYLDLGDAWWRGDWRNAVNGLWSPLYSVIAGGVLAAARPSSYWEFPTVHLVNLGLSVVALFCFAFFVNSLLMRRATSGERENGFLPAWTVVLLGSSAYLVSSLVLTGASPTTPDVLMATTFLLSMGLVLRIERDPANAKRYALLGGVLGIGYLAKAPMLPLGTLILLFLLIQAIFGPRLARGGSIRRVALAGAVFLGVAAPYVGMLSTVKGFLTTGESGRLNYAWHVNGAPRFHWRGEPAGSGAAQHPTRILHQDPPVYEFGQPVQGTYPIWYDAAYWNAGLTPHFEWRSQWKVIRSAISTYRYVFINVLGGFWLGFVPLALLARRTLFGDLAQSWIVLGAAIAPFAMYALVHTETRYLGVFAATMCAALLAKLRIPVKRTSIATVLVIAASAGLLARVGMESVKALREAGRASHTHWDIASGLAESGVRRGDRVAFLRPTAASGNHAWARLSGLRIVAEMSAADVPALWTASAETRDRVESALKSARVSSIVAADVPPGVSANWTALGTTGLYVRKLNP